MTVYAAVTRPETVDHRKSADARTANKVLHLPYRPKDQGMGRQRQQGVVRGGWRRKGTVMDFTVNGETGPMLPTRLRKQ